jgi:Thrombospondin type 3 repeat
VRARPLLAWGAAVAVLSLLLVLARTDNSDAGTFNPVLEITLANTEPETPSDVTVSFGIANPDDVNFGGVVSFIPADFGIVRGDRIPIGEKVGELDALATLGLINAPCNQSLAVHFDFLNATTDKSETVSFDDLEELAGDTSAEGFGTEDFAEDKDGNGLLDSIDHWPEFIDRVTGPVQPFRRSAGIATVAGIPVLLQFLIYNPGTEFDLPGEDLEQLLPKDPALGFPTIVLLQNVGDPDINPEPGPITDFCTPLTSTNVAFGTALDADRDGTNNENDTCPYDAHPLMGTHDEDFDFLHTQCDPDDAENEEDPSQSGKNEDQDDDGIDNFADNCPLVVNEDQADEDEDFIGDECDQNPSEPDGVIDLSMLPLAGDYEFTVFTVGQRDADNDSYQNSMDTCPFVTNAGNPTLLAGGDADQDGLDAACDPNDDLTTGGANSDEDGDGYLNRQDNCPLILNGQESSDDPTGNQNDEDFDTIGDVCDPAPDTPDGELIDLALTAEITVGSGGAGGRPTNCPDCQVPGDPPEPVVDQGSEDGGDAAESGDDGGSSSTIFIIIGAVAAAVVVIGGGAFLLLRRGG